MKKSKLILFFFLISFQLISQITGEAVYQLSIDKRENLNEKKYRGFKKIEETAKKFKLKLTFNNTNSHYVLEKPMKMDYIQESLFKMAEIVFKSNGEFYMEVNNKMLIEKKEFDDKKYIIESKINISDWKLTNETLKIGKFLCLKAKRNFIYESRKGKTSIEQVVWYTPEIPLPFGPLDFVGFPGLVIQVKSGNIITSLKTLRLNPKKNINVLLPKEGVKITKQEFLKITKKARERLFKNK